MIKVIVKEHAKILGMLFATLLTLALTLETLAVMAPNVLSIQGTARVTSFASLWIR